MGLDGLSLKKRGFSLAEPPAEVMQSLSWLKLQIPTIFPSDDAQFRKHLSNLPFEYGGFWVLENNTYDSIRRLIVTPKLSLSAPHLPLELREGLVLCWRNCTHFALSAAVKIGEILLGSGDSINELIRDCLFALEINHYFPIDLSQYRKDRILADGRVIRMVAHVDEWPFSVTFNYKGNENGLEMADCERQFTPVTYPDSHCLIHVGRALSKLAQSATGLEVLAPLHRVVLPNGETERFSIVLKCYQKP